MRPLGGLLWGHLGDKIGRQRTLAAVIILMAVGTVGIGLLPSYAAIGVAAPILVVALRCVQGFSAGGEIMGASTFRRRIRTGGAQGFPDELYTVRDHGRVARRRRDRVPVDEHLPETP